MDMNLTPQGFSSYQPRISFGPGPVTGYDPYPYPCPAASVSTNTTPTPGFSSDSSISYNYHLSNAIQGPGTFVNMTGGREGAILNASGNSVQPNPNIIAIDPTATAVTTQTELTSDPHSSYTASENKDQSQNQNQLIRFSHILTKNVPFFLDLQIFIMSLQEIYNILNSDDDASNEQPSPSSSVTSPGPSGMLDLYQLYCQHLAGDPHITRTLEGIINTSIRNQNPAALSLQELMQIAREKAPSFGQKKENKLRQFYHLYKIPFALAQPFICGESVVRFQLCQIWFRESGTGPLYKRRMCQLYKQYCLHIEAHEKLFYALFGLSVVLPHGPFRISNLEQMVIMLKSMPFKKSYSNRKQGQTNKDNDNSTAEFDIYSENDMAIVHYIRQDFGMDHQLFQSLPATLRYIVGNEPVTISVPKLSRPVSSFGNTPSLSSNIEFMKLCSVSPASSKDTNRIQLKFPSDLTNPDYEKVFSWVFLSTEVPGIFVIKNQQWNEYLMVADAASRNQSQPDIQDNYEFCQLSTSPDYKDESRRTNFSLIIEGQEVHIFSSYANSPIVIDGRLQRAIVPRKIASASEAASDFNFGLGTVFFIRLA